MKVTDYCRRRAAETEAAQVLSSIIGTEAVKMEDAHLFRSAIEQGAQTFDDKTASEVVTIFPSLHGDGSLIKAGMRINWGGTLKQAAVDLWDTAENSPDNAPTLWADIAYREGIRVIPDTITAAQAFALDELGWWQEHIYRSTIVANVYTPDQYAAGWEQLT